MIIPLFKPEEAVSFEGGMSSFSDSASAGSVTLAAGGTFTLDPKTIGAIVATTDSAPVTGGGTPAYWPPISPPPTTTTTTTVSAKSADLTPAAPIKDSAGIKDITPTPVPAPVSAAVAAKPFDWKTALIIVAILVAVFIAYKFMFKKGK